MSKPKTVKVIIELPRPLFERIERERKRLGVTFTVWLEKTLQTPWLVEYVRQPRWAFPKNKLIRRMRYSYDGRPDAGKKPGANPGYWWKAHDPQTCRIFECKTCEVMAKAQAEEDAKYAFLKEEPGKAEGGQQGEPQGAPEAPPPVDTPTTCATIPKS